MAWLELCLQRSRSASGDLVVRLGVPLLDRYLDFLAVRSRPNTVLAAAYDLRVFFAVVGKAPHEVTSADVLGFVTAQHTGGGLGRLQPVAQGAVGVSARTVHRRLSSVSGLFGFLLARGDVGTNPVPRGLPTRRVEALYGQGNPRLPADAIGPRMARLRREHHRLLGNGYCTRPPELDCAFEAICETCTFFQTSIEFRPTLQRSVAMVEAFEFAQGVQ